MRIKKIKILLFNKRIHIAKELSLDSFCVLLIWYFPICRIFLKLLYQLITLIFVIEYHSVVLSYLELCYVGAEGKCLFLPCMYGVCEPRAATTELV